MPFSPKFRAAGFGSLAFAVAACGGNNPSYTPQPHPSVTASPTMTPAMAQLVTIPLSPGNTTDPAPRIMVAFPAASPFSFVLDTGSTGLRILPNAMQAIPTSSYTNTGTQTSNSFGGDRVFYGTIGIANTGVTFGGTVAEPAPLKFQIVSKVCAGVPSPVPTGAPAGCQDITQQNEAQIGGGFVGVRPNGTQPIDSPFADLASPLNSGFVVSAYGASPSVLTGATIQNQSGFQTFAVTPQAAPDGSPAWANGGLLPFCYTVTAGASQAPQGCPSPGVLMDTGGLNEHITLPVAPPAGLAPNVQETLPPGSTVVATLAQPGSAASITWTLTTGTCYYYDDPQFYFNQPNAMPAPMGTPPASNNGITPFLANDVLFDLKDGALGLRPVTTNPPSYC